MDVCCDADGGGARRSAMTVRVVILNWNGRRWLDGCLSALASQTLPPSEVVIVDNASTDDSVVHLTQRWPSVRVLPLTENVGFAAGNNRGAEGADTEALVFLNNDTEVEPGWLAALVAAAAGDTSRGLVASRIVFMDRPDLIDSAGDGYLRCGGGYKRGHGQPAISFSSSCEVFGACGAAFLIRRSLFESLGGFDPSFFMVYEDVDLSYRARLLGARVWYAADAVVRHAGSASMGRVSALAVYCGQRNLEWTWLKNTPAQMWWRSLPAHLAYNAAGAVAYARHGRLLDWMRGKGAAVMAAPRLWRERRQVQGRRVVAESRLRDVMDADWVQVKRLEKRFAFRPASPDHHGAADE
jgi:GT2 family glycosyltransferase